MCKTWRTLMLIGHRELTREIHPLPGVADEVKPRWMEVATTEAMSEVRRNLLPRTRCLRMPYGQYCTIRKL